MKKKGFTLIELLVVIAIIAMLLAILMPALNKVKKIAQRVICGTNLKGLGTAQTVYAGDFADSYTVQGGLTNPTWVVEAPTALATLGAANWQALSLPWGTKDLASSVTTGCSLYLLVRLADVNPKSFICPGGGETVFDGKNSNNLDITQLWDFGLNPTNSVSYSYHEPYKNLDTVVTGGTGKKSRFAATNQRSAGFAIMADRNPFHDKKLTYTTGIPTQSGQSALLTLDTTTTQATRLLVQVANAQPHDRDGQNVTFADGHNSYESRSDVGIKNDNIYTRWTSPTPATTDEAAWRKGAHSITQTASVEDSVLVNENIPLD
jgi:prepilin-type N-terminal cleavage/methylation domain-containing protein